MLKWEEVSFVMASEPRFQVLINLKEQIRTPTELTNKIGVPISRVSTVLKELEKKDLIQCLTPNRRKSKLFKITKKGEEIIKEIHKITS